MKFCKQLIITLILICCATPKSYTTTRLPSSDKAMAMLIIGMACGTGFGYLVAETTKKPTNFSEPETPPNTIKDKTNYFYAKNYNELRTLLFSVAGAVSGGLLLFVPRTIYEKMHPNECNKELCEQEIAEIEQRFRGFGPHNLTPEEQQLFDQIETDLTVDNGWTDFWGNHHPFLHKPWKADVLDQMREQLINKVKIKYARIEHELNNKAKQDHKPKADETYKCPICLDVPTNPQINYNCEHTICADCYDGFINQPGSNKCPVCRQARKNPGYY